MSNEEEDVQVVKNFFAAIGSGHEQALLALVDEGIEWIIPGEDWPLAGTHRGHGNWRMCFRGRPQKWKRYTQSPLNSWRRETGFWSSASPRGKSRPRISRSRTIGSSTSPFEMAN